MVSVFRAGPDMPNDTLLRQHIFRKKITLKLIHFLSFIKIKHIGNKIKHKNMKKVHPNLLNSTKAIFVVFVTVCIVQEVQEVHRRRNVDVHHCTAKKCNKTKNFLSNN